MAVDPGELVRVFVFEVAKLDGERVFQKPVAKAPLAVGGGVPLDHFRAHEIGQGTDIFEGRFAARLF